MRCPRDDEELSGGTPAKCSNCKGCWVSVKDLAKTVRTDPAATLVGPSKLTCPECYAPMQLITLHDVQLDRCSQHGVWFDIEEISDVLRKTGKLAPNERAREDKPSTGENIAEGAAAVGVGVLEILSSVFGA